MVLKAVASLKEIKKLDVQTVSTKKTEKPKSPKPTYNKKVNFEEVLGQFKALTDVLFSVRGGEEYNFTKIGELLVQSLVGDIEKSSKGKIPNDKISIRALEEICFKAAVGREGYCNATRTKHIIGLMNETPFMENGEYARLVISGDQVLLEACDRRDASSVVEVVEELYGKLPYDFLAKVEISKTNRMDYLRRVEFKIMRENTPDFGITMIPAALGFKGFQRGLPISDIGRTNYPTITWVMEILNDYINVLNKCELDVFAPFLDSISIDEYAELYRLVQSVSSEDGDPMIRRQRAKSLYDTDPAKFDVARIKYKEVHDELTSIQQEAIDIVKEVLELVAFKKSLKDWYRELDKLNNPQRYVKEEKHASHPVLTAVKDEEETPVAKASEIVTSTTTPDQAVESLGVEEVDVDISIPRFNATALGFSELERKDAIEAAGIDGPRICEAYPGVVWEAVIGPIDHALDVKRCEPDCRMVVIAPRRVGGLGLDMNQTRVLLVDEYEAFFSKI